MTEKNARRASPLAPTGGKQSSGRQLPRPSPPHAHTGARDPAGSGPAGAGNGPFRERSGEGRGGGRENAALATLLAHIKQHFGALQPAFLAMDVNRDRVISCEEFRRGVRMAKLGLTDGEIDAIFQALDSDGSGELDYQELCRRFSAADLKRAQSNPRPLRRDESRSPQADSLPKAQSRSPQADAISPQQEQAEAVRTESAELQRVRQLQEEAEAMEKQRRVLANHEARDRLQSIAEEQHLRRQLQVAQEKERRQADLRQARLENEREIQRRRACRHSRGDSRERAR